MDIRLLQRRGVLIPGTTKTIGWDMLVRIQLAIEFQRVRLRYRLDGVPIEQCINLGDTRVRYGRRAWFGCPSCGRLCAKLYLRGRFVCRACARLHYECQSAAPQRRVVLRYLKLWHRLQGEFGEISRPKWMRRVRFETLRREVSRLESLAGLLGDGSMDRPAPDIGA